MVDEREFDALFRQHYAELFVFAKRFLQLDADCEDVVADAFEDLWRHLDRLDAATVRPFLYKSVRNNCIDHLRRQSTRRQYAALMAAVSLDYESADWLAELREREQTVQRVVDSLPDYTRQIFSACYVDHKRYAEVAAEQGISVSTVKKYVMRALALIAAQREKLKKT